MDLIPNKKILGGTNNPLAAMKNAGFSLENFLKKGIILAALLVVVSLAAWIAFKVYESYADKKIQNLQAQQAAIFSANDKIEANKILAIEANAVALQSLLKSHFYTSDFFDWLAEGTLPRVQWTSCGLNSQKGLATLRGQVGDYPTLAKQILAFSAEETGFKNIQVSNIALSKAGDISFDLSFEIDSKKLQKQ